MKKFFGLCILVILLVAASGCTQPAATTTTTPAPTTVVTTQVATPEPTQPPATVATTVAPTTVVTTEVPVANVTAKVTEVVTTAAKPKATATPSTKITTIYIRNNTFVPNELTVLPGTGITWINDDKVVHAIKTNAQSPFKFDSGDMIPTASYMYSYTANEGSYGYFDPTTNATGVIIIKKGESFVGMGTPLPTATTA
jgi:plastocyanin